MNREIVELREVITKLVPLLTGKGLKVTQRGTQAYVLANAKTNKPEIVNIPSIPDNASSDFISAVSGFVDHEVGHVLFTDWKFYGGNGIQVAKNSPEGKALTMMHNIIEDTFIEREIVKTFPGSERNLDLLHRHFLDKITTPAVVGAAGNEKAQFDYLIVPMMRALSGQQTFIDFMDANGHWKHPMIENLHMAMSDEALELIKKARNTSETLEVAQEIHDILFNNKRKEEAEQQAQQQPQPKQKPKKGKSQDKPEKQAGQGDGTGERKHDEDGEGSPTAGDDGEGGQGEQQSTEGSGGSAGAPGADDEDESEDGAAGSQQKGDEDADDDAEAGAGGASEEEEPEDADEEGAGDGGDDADDESEGEGSASGDGEGDEEAGESAEGMSEQEENDGIDGNNTGGSEDESQGGGGAGGEAGKSMFDLDPADFNAVDLSSAISQQIEQMAVKAVGESDYSVFTKDEDRIEPLEVDDKYMKDEWVPELEDKVAGLVGPMQKDIERLMAAQSLSVRTAGHRSGRLHSASLYRVMQGDGRVFQRKQEHNSKDTAVMLLVDNSGSMSGSRIVVAMQAAYALAQTLERVNIANEIVGFTTGHLSRSAMEQLHKEHQNGVRFNRHSTIVMPIYKSFGERVTPQVKKRIAYQLNVQSGMNTNTDGESLEYAALRLLPRRETRKVMLVMSDGQPVGSNAPYHLKATAKKLNQMGIETVGIGIQSNAVQSFYDRSMVLNDVADLPAAVMGELKRILSR